MTMQDVVERLKERGFNYTIHGIRKHLDMGLVPTHKHTPNKTRNITELDFENILFNVRMLSVGFTIKEIKKMRGEGFSPLVVLQKVDQRKNELLNLLYNLRGLLSEVR